jgi:hypothetical protein
VALVSRAPRPIQVHLSWLVIFALIAWSLSVGYFPQQLPGLPLVAHWANGVLAALLLFLWPSEPNILLFTGKLS